MRLTLYGLQIPISIHALREEGDPRTPAAWCVPLTISIHALREEGDRTQRSNQTTACDFYPRPPRGGRLIALLSLRMDSLNFYPRPPRGGRPGAAAPVLVVVDFYPRPPRGGRLRMPAFLFAVTAFLSTPSARRATRDPRRRSGGPGISIHALREEGDSSWQWKGR